MKSIQFETRNETVSMTLHSFCDFEEIHVSKTTGHLLKVNYNTVFFLAISFHLQFVLLRSIVSIQFEQYKSIPNKRSYHE